MHPKSSIEAFSQDPWLPPGPADAEDSTVVTDTQPGEQDTFSPILQLPLTPIVETIEDEPQTREVAEELNIPAPILIEQTAIGELDVPLSPDTPAEISASSTDDLTRPVSAPLPAPDEVSAPPIDNQASVSLAPLSASNEVSAPPIDDITHTPSAPLIASYEDSISPTGDLTYTSASVSSAPGDISTSPTGELLHTPIFSMSTIDEVSTSPTHKLGQIPSTPLPDEISNELTQVPSTPLPDEMSSELTQVPSTPLPDEMSSELTQVPSTPLPDEISTSSTGELAQISLMPTLDEIAATPTDNLERAALFPPPTPERRSTPRPVRAETHPLLVPHSAGNGSGRVRPLIVALIIVLMVLAAGVGAFALGRQNAPASTQCNAQQTNCANGSPVVVNGKPTHLTFSGAVVGPMTIVAKPSCQTAASGSLRTLTINLSGTINGQLYNFGFAIEHYTGPSTYSSAADTTILFDVPGESTTNGWGNSAPADAGSITVDRGEQTGSISYILSGIGTHANTQLQATGNWTCGK